MPNSSVNQPPSKPPPAKHAWVFFEIPSAVDWKTGTDVKMTKPFSLFPKIGEAITEFHGANSALEQDVAWMNIRDAIENWKAKKGSGWLTSDRNKNGMVANLYETINKGLEELVGEEYVSVQDSGTDDEDILVAAVKLINSNQNDISAAIKLAVEAMKSDDESEVSKAASALFESLTGAAPDPTQGTNLIYQLSTAADDASKVVRAFQDKAKAVSDASGFQGDVAGSVASVDITWQAVASVLSAAMDVFNIGKLIAEAQRSSPGKKIDLKKLLVGQSASLFTNLVKSYSTVGSAIATISSMATGASILGAGVALSVSGAGPLAMLAMATRCGWKASKSRKRARRLHKIFNTTKDQISKETQELLAFAIGKSERKRNYKAAQMGGAVVGSSAGTCLAVGAVLAGANAWNPVGWGLGVVCVVGGAGLLSYKVVRRYSSNRRAEARGFSTQEFAEKLVTAYVDARRIDVDGIDALALGGMLEDYGCEPAWLHTNTSADIDATKGQIETFMNRIDRHLENS